jgi:hypothetical protein
MRIQIIIIISIVIALLGTMIGAAMVSVDKQKASTYIEGRLITDPNYKPPSRRKLFLPMVICLAISLALMIIGVQSGNIIGFSVGFLLLFIGFGLLGAFLLGR